MARSTRCGALAAAIALYLLCLNAHLELALAVPIGAFQLTGGATSASTSATPASTAGDDFDAFNSTDAMQAVQKAEERIRAINDAELNWDDATARAVAKVRETRAAAYAAARAILERKLPGDSALRTHPRSAELWARVNKTIEDRIDLHLRAHLAPEEYKTHVFDKMVQARQEQGMREFRQRTNARNRTDPSTATTPNASSKPATILSLEDLPPHAFVNLTEGSSVTGCKIDLLHSIAQSPPSLNK